MDDIFLEQLEDMGADVERTLNRLSGDKQLYFQFLKTFVADSNLEILAHAVLVKNRDMALKAVHTLKGVSLNLGFCPCLTSASIWSYALKPEKPKRRLVKWICYIIRLKSGITLYYQP